jgi:hypothetical protein
LARAAAEHVMVLDKNYKTLLHERKQSLILNRNIGDDKASCSIPAGKSVDL